MACCQPSVTAVMAGFTATFPDAGVVVLESEVPAVPPVGVGPSDVAPVPEVVEQERQAAGFVSPST